MQQLLVGLSTIILDFKFLKLKVTKLSPENRKKYGSNSRKGIEYSRNLMTVRIARYWLK